MTKRLLIYRRKLKHFNSIENVFNTLLPYLDTCKIELPLPSNGIRNALKNIKFVQSIPSKLYHITGNDHYLILGLKKKRTILTIHDIEILKRSTGIKRFIIKKIWFDWPIKYSTQVTTISEFSKKEILGLKKYTTPIAVIHNPLTLPLKHVPKPFNKECPIILHIGVKKNKNLERLIGALKDINCQLVIIGNPDKSEMKLLIQFGINYTLKSELSTQEIVQEYENCDLLSFVSTYEGFGLPVIEAQAIGRVVLASNVASIPEIAGDGALMVDPYSVAEIRQGILQLISDDSLRAQLISQGLQNVKRFEPNKIAQKYLSIYDSVNHA